MHKHFTLYRFVALWLLLTMLAGCGPTAETPPPTTSAPTPLPAPLLLNRGLAARLLGDDQQAEQEFYAIQIAHPDAPEARRARFYQAESLARQGRWSEATPLFSAFVAQPQTDNLNTYAHFWLARAHETAGSHSEAISAYEAYRQLNPVLEPYARIRQATQERALGRTAAAQANDQAVATMADLPRPVRAAAYERLIADFRQAGNPSAALDAYTAILAFARVPSYRGRILVEAAGLARDSGNLEQARTWLREAASFNVELGSTLAAVEQLRADPAANLDPALAARTLVVYERYDEALPLFDAAITASSGETALALRRERALTLRNLQRFSEAQTALDEIVSESPDSSAGRQARLDSAQTRGQSGDAGAAIAEYQAFAQLYPNDERAPEALSRAAIWQSRLNDSAAALRTRLELGQRYPQSRQGRDALDATAREYLASGRAVEAQALWEQLSRQADPNTAARASFWAARAAQRTNPAAATPLLEQTLSLAPTNYEGIRAHELLGRSISNTHRLGDPVTADDLRVSREWITSWFTATVEKFNQIGGEVGAHPHVRRAMELPDVGLQSEALGEWLAAIELWSEQPIHLYHLARLAEADQQATVALRAATVLFQLAPNQGRTAPATILRLLYPAPFATAVVREAKAYGFSPHLFLALLRQESLFDPNVTSSAGARGIAQVMPETGRGIASQLGVTDYNPDQLYRPSVGLRYGAFYLAEQLAAFNGSAHAALAAYNGGPGNAERWAGGNSVADADAFIEVIDFGETRNYVRLVYTYYGIYRQLYAP
jgi:soluble lytic murein transglycosylase